MRKNVPPIAAVLIVLLTVYVGSYFALLNPPQSKAERVRQIMATNVTDYRIGGELVATVFLPLEYIDRRLRPELWEPGNL